ncbi:MAG: tRNA (guanosine(37)-N1)-methyltransferase TrmD [Geodermatophilaceae bacterium]
MSTPLLRIDVITIFPAYLAPLRESLLGRATEQGLLAVGVHDLRDWTTDVHRSVDDAPYGGGPGMVMRPEPWHAALAAVAPDGATLVVPTPGGDRFDQETAAELAGDGHLVFACGRYEGIDQRVADEAAHRLQVRELSVGDYVLAGGEAAVLVIVEAVTRLLPGVVGNAESVQADSFSAGLLEAPAYTRPEQWRGHAVPAVLRSGDHAAIARWRRDQSLLRTASRRPDLIEAADLDAADRAVLAAGGFHPPSPGVAQ